MYMFRVTREIDFCYGHRLLNYDGKCRHLHGHNGRAVITLSAAALDRLGMVMDFTQLKRVVGGWIDANLDHKMLLHRDDPALPMLTGNGRDANAAPSPDASVSAVRSSPGYGSKRRARSRVAIPAAIATGFPLSVPAWYTGPVGASRSIRSRRPPKAAHGKPPPITLPSVVRSGVTFQRVCAPPYPIRNPVITSSKIRTLPLAVHRARRPPRKPSSGGITPMFAATGSTITQAIRSPAIVEHAVHSVQVVVRRGEGILRRALGDPGGAGDPERREPAPAALGEEGVGVSVVATVELQDPVASGRGPRQAHRGHRGLRPARDQPDQLDPRDRVDDALRELDLPFGRCAERRALGRRRARRADDLGVGMAEEQSPPRADEVDVPVPVDVDDVRTLTAGDESRGAADGAERPDGRVDAAGDHRSGANEELLRPGHGPMLRKRWR